MRKRTNTTLEGSLTRKLEELLRDVQWLRGWKIESLNKGTDTGFDIRVNIPLSTGGKAILCVECKKEMRPSVFRMRVEKSFPTKGKTKVIVPVLALPWVSPRVAELCEEHGWSWYDLTGNYRLDIPGILHVRHTGNKPSQKQPSATVNLGTPEAGRVIRVLLASLNAGRIWTQRDIQKHCQPTVSIGLVNKVVRYLRDEAFIHGERGFQLRDPVPLLLAWRDAYRFGRHERRNYFSLLQGGKLHAALEMFGGFTRGYAMYASFSAAEFQAPYVRQAKTWLYVHQREIQRFEEMIEAKEVESGENLVVLIPDDEGVFYLVEGSDNKLPCTNVVQTYVDLYHSGGRGKEAAEAILNQRLRPEWKMRGLKV